MKFYRDVDYYLYFEDFPHMGVPGVTVLNTDGTVNIFINTLYKPEIQTRTVKHELRHMVLNHFFTDWLPIETKELEADETDDPNCVFARDFSSVEYLGKVRFPQQYKIPFVQVEEEAQAMTHAAGGLHIALEPPVCSKLTEEESEAYLQDVEKALNKITNIRKRDKYFVRSMLKNGKARTHP